MITGAGRFAAAACAGWAVASSAYAMGPPGGPGGPGGFGGGPRGPFGAGASRVGLGGGGPGRDAPPSLRDFLFGGREPDRHFGSAPPVARYNADAGQPFVLDRQARGALLRFDNSQEVWALNATAGPRGDLIFKNDVGQPMLRVSRLGGVTLFTDGRPMGAAAYVVGQAASLRVQPSIGPDALIRSLSEASRRASRAAQHLVVFDAPSVTADNDWVFADAAFIASEAFARLSATGQRGRVVLQRVFQVTLVPGRAPTVQAVGARVEIVVAPEQGVAGRPSSERIYTALTSR